DISPVEFRELPALQDAVIVVGYPIGGTRNLSEFNADRDTISITRAEDGTLDQHQPSLSSRSFSGRGRLLSGDTIFLGGFGGTRSHDGLNQSVHSMYWWYDGFKAYPSTWLNRDYSGEYKQGKPYVEARRLFKEPLACVEEEQLDIKWSAPDEELKMGLTVTGSQRLESFFKPLASTSVPIKRKCALDSLTHALAPEYFMYGKVNDKIDVYAFGVVLFELLSGRKPISNEYPKGEESLVMRAKPILNSGKFSQLLDQSLGNNYDADQMERMTLAFTLCIRRAPRARPHMSSVGHHQESVLEVGLPNLLEDGIKMLIYVGKYNLVCNLLGFEASEISEFKVDGKLAGLLKNYGPLTFLEANVLGHQNVALRYEKYRRIKIRIVWDSS
ncbi:probable receptor-like serine/threonine-protein kinase, partial [Tanacetum coccineum]